MQTAAIAIGGPTDVPLAGALGFAVRFVSAVGRRQLPVLATLKTNRRTDQIQVREGVFYALDDQLVSATMETADGSTVLAHIDRAESLQEAALGSSGSDDALLVVEWTWAGVRDLLNNPWKQRLYRPKWATRLDIQMAQTGDYAGGAGYLLGLVDIDEANAPRIWSYGATVPAGVGDTIPLANASGAPQQPWRHMVSLSGQSGTQTSAWNASSAVPMVGPMPPSDTLEVYWYRNAAGGTLAGNVTRMRATWTR